MPRRNHRAGPRPQANVATRELRYECGCRRDGLWRCPAHWREHMATLRSTGPGAHGAPTGNGNRNR